MKLLGISGVARSGKDSVCQALLELAPKWSTKKWKRFALADPLKDELADFILDNYGIDIYHKDFSTEEKKIIRPLLVAHGCIKRELSNNTYWWKLCEKRILKENKDGGNIITDIRFCDSGDTDEFNWLKSNGGKLIHITRINEGGKILAPPNEQEAYYDPILREYADFRIEWPTLETQEERVRWIQKTLDLGAIFDTIKLDT